MAVLSLPFMLHPRSPPSVTPWWTASDLCLDANLASDLKAMYQKAWKPEEEPRAGAASKANVSFPSSHLVFCPLHAPFFLQTLVSDLIWSRLLTWLSIVNHHANVFQVFPIVRLKITWWVREETVKGQISKPESQKVRFDETAIFKQGKKRKMMGGFYLYLCPQPISIL